jgi:hypothetical protein
MALAHVASYFMAAHDHVHRSALLTETGHGSSGTFEVLAPILGLLALATIVGASAGGRLSRISSWQVAGLQMGAFVLIEGVERATVGTSLLDLLAEPVFQVGLAFQLLIAALVTWVAQALTELVLRITRSRKPRQQDRIYFDPSSVDFTPTRSLSKAAWNLRGPPPTLSHT